MSEDRHYHTYSVDDCLGNHGFLENETDFENGAESYVGTVVDFNGDSGTSLSDDEYRQSIKTAISLPYHLFQCISDMFTLFICILMLKNWLQVNIVAEPGVLDAFLERRSPFSEPRLSSCHRTSSESITDSVSDTDSELESNRDDDSKEDVSFLKFGSWASSVLEDYSDGDSEDEFTDSQSISSQCSWFQEHHPNW